MNAPTGNSTISGQTSQSLKVRIACCTPGAKRVGALRSSLLSLPAPTGSRSSWLTKKPAPTRATDAAAAASVHLREPVGLAATPLITGGLALLLESVAAGAWASGRCAGPFPSGSAPAAAGGSSCATSPTKRKPRPWMVRMSFCADPSSLRVWRAALIRLLRVASETIRPFHTRSMISSLLTARCQFSISMIRRSKTCGSTGTRAPSWRISYASGSIRYAPIRYDIGFRPEGHRHGWNGLSGRPYARDYRRNPRILQEYSKPPSSSKIRFG